MEITQHVRKWGNGNAVRLPKKVLDAAKLHAGQELSVHLRGRSIVLTPIVKRTQPTLEQLLKGVTPQAVGGEYEPIVPDNNRTLKRLANLRITGGPTDLSANLDHYLYHD